VMNDSLYPLARHGFAPRHRVGALAALKGAYMNIDIHSAANGIGLLSVGLYYRAGILTFATQHSL